MRILPARTLAAIALVALALAAPVPGALAQDAAVGGSPALNCGHFVTIDDAQNFFEAVVARTGIDRYGLDANADGTACEGGVNTSFDLSCALFVEQPDAQALYDLNRSTYGVLDADGDGIACSPQQAGGGGKRGGSDTGAVVVPTDAGTSTTTTTTTTTGPFPSTEITLPQNFPFGTGPSEIGIEISPDQLDALDADCLSFAVIGTMVMGHNCAGGDFIGTLPPGTPPDMRISHTPFFQAGAIFTPVGNGGGGGGGGRNGGAGQSPAIDPNTGQPVQQQAQPTDTATTDTGGKRTRTKQKASDAGDAQATAEAAQPARRERKDRIRHAREDAISNQQQAGADATSHREAARAERKARKAERRAARRAARAEAETTAAATEQQPVSAESIQRSVDRAVERAFRER